MNITCDLPGNTYMLRGVVPVYPAPQAGRELGCGLCGIAFGGDDTVILQLPPGECTDMTGAIALATAILPDCRRILTVADAYPDTSYHKRADGQWVARMAREHDE